MPKAEVTNEDPYPIPLDTLIPLRLDTCTREVIEYTPKTGKNVGTKKVFVKWEWSFQVVGGEYEGLTVRGNTEPKITELLDQQGSLKLAKPFIEALLNRTIELGEEIDTDDLIGLQCQGTVSHIDPRPKKDGQGSWFNVEIEELYPASFGPGSPGAVTGPSGRTADPWAGEGATQVYGEPPF